MPSGKHRDFDDTWKHDELEKSLKGTKDDRKKSRDKDRDRDREKSRRREDEDRHRRRRDDDDRRERRHHDRENGEVDRKDRHRSNRHEDTDEQTDDRDRSHRRHVEDRDHGEDRKHRKPREEEDDRERRHRRHQEENGEDRDKRHRRPKEGEDEDRERRHRRHRDEDDEDRERRHRKHRDEDHDRDRPQRHRDRDYEEEDDIREKRHKRGDEDEEERRRRKERERRHREENGERPHKHRDDDERREKRNDERHHRRRDEDEEERRRRHEERKRQREREKEEQREREREEENRRQREREKQREAERVREKRKKEPDQKKMVEKAEEEDAEDDYGDYEDDFEDYDDDFEDDDEENEEAEQKNTQPASTKNDLEGLDEGEEDEGHSRGYYMSLDWDPKQASHSEVDEIKRAMDEENERLARHAQRTDQQDARRYGDDDYDSGNNRRGRYEDDDDGYYDNSRRDNQSRSRQPAQRSFINFVSAKQRQITGAASSKARRRGNELSKLIELDFAKFELFDMPPVSEYDLYMRSFGSTGTRQAYVQTSEDNVEREIQTEEVETRELYTQHPADQSDPVGGPEFEKKSEEYLATDGLSLSRFIQRAGTLILNILEEDAAERAQEALADSRQRSSICLSEAFAELRTDHLSLLKERIVIHSHFSPVQTNLLLTVHSTKTQATEGDIHANKGVVCLWNVNEPDQPQKVLVCESRPRCCCFSPSRASLAFSGMHDGSLSVWDLREFSSQHKSYKDCDTELVLRYPTYSTAGVLQYENHQSAVVSIQPIVMPGDSTTASLGESGEGEGMSFQLATLEENSVIHLWVVAEISQPDPAGSEFDLGLSPGGRIKVIRSSTIQLESPLRDARLRTTMTAFDMQLLPSNNSHFYVATDTGCVIHGVRYGGKAPPRTYVGETDSPVRVTSIDFSPFPESVFLAGCEDGTLRLHHTDGEYPFIIWPNATGGAPITCVRWSRSRPSVFFVLDAQARLHIWDLTMSDAVPMKFEQIAEERVTSFEMSNDYSATGLGQPGRKPQMVVSLESGSTEVHTLSREFSALMADEVDQFAQLIQRIT